jgi:tellurite resistance protein TehA-like permease
MWKRLRDALPALSPACFAPVMATGIVSRALSIDHARTAAEALLVVGVAAYAGLAAAVTLRLAVWRALVAREAGDPARLFGFFTFVAASDVLAQRLAADHRAVAFALFGGAVVAWLLVVGRSLAVLLRAGARRAAAGVADGTWFLCAVGAQSAVLADTALRHPEPAGLVGWALGVLLYALAAVPVARRLLSGAVGAARLTPPYWVGMGGMAISVLAGAALLPRWPGLDVPLLVMWTWASALIPVLAGAMVWRHAVRRVPLRYETGWWSAVFPIGMYAVASSELGAGLDIAWLERLGHGAVWCGFTAWLLVGAGLCAGHAGAVRQWRQRRLARRRFGQSRG